MRKYLMQNIPIVVFLVLNLIPSYAQDRNSTATTPVQMMVTLRVQGKDKRTPEVRRDDIIVRQGKERLQVTGWTPLGDVQSGVDLFFLIDDAAHSSLALQFDDLRSFIRSLPANTTVGVGYMRHGTVQITQDLTSDHERAAKALRLPRGSSGVYGSPYLSAIDLMKRWPERSNSREIVMITDGIERLRGGPRHRGLASSSPDVDSASSVTQRTGTIIHTIFTRGVGHLASNSWEITNAQNSMAKLSRETGGESYFLGTQNAVSFRPYLESLQRSLDYRYLLEFNAVPSGKSGLQHVKLTTEIAGVELNSADSVWVNAR